MTPKTLAKRKKSSTTAPRGSVGRIAAGEFKARCLSLIDEVNETGHELIITKRGIPTAKLIPFTAPNIDSFFGRLKGIVEIVGDPDDLVKPIIPLEDWDMLK
jgi:prevent-host-death family protein